MTANSLRLVDLVNEDGTHANGLIRVNPPRTARLRIDEQVAVSDAGRLNRIDYIFFRRFSDGRSSQVAAYVIDNSDERLTETELGQIHLQAWLHGKAPLLYIAWPSRIDLLTCARGPDFWREQDGECRYNPAIMFETAGAISEQIKTLSVLRLADGTFWEDPSNRKLTDHEKAAHHLLIQAVVDVDNELEGEKKPLLRRLLLLMVLIKYLEDRSVFPDGWFAKFHAGAQSFREVLQSGEPAEVKGLLDSLERRFDGDIFAVDDIGNLLTRDHLLRFADLVEARTLKKLRYLWEQFSFKHLPVEIISYLYQKFVNGEEGRKKGAIYTPPMLSALLLDHAMPYENLTGQETILDPSCGSGVFLVGAFRRLINVWRSQNRWQPPDVNTLKRLLKSRLFGIEIDKNAIDLTAFSLCLTICDALQPNVIWRDLKFDRLHGSNLILGDFFQVARDWGDGQYGLPPGGIDVIIGNPPFVSGLSQAGKEIVSGPEYVSQWPELPDNQTAYLFLQQALSVLKPGGRLCLIQPNGFLYNGNSAKFRTAIFQKFKVDTIFDFTSIRNLYEADAKTIAALACKADVPQDHRIKHWTFRRTFTVEEQIGFELDHYDRHLVPQRLAEEADLEVWRAQLLGGGRLVDMVLRLRRMRTLAEFVKQKGWTFAEGFIVGNRAHYKPYLKDMPFLPPKAFTDAGIDESRIDVVKETHFKSAPGKEQFTAPLVLIKESASLPVVFWNEGFLAYTARIVGIHASESEISELKKFYNKIRDRLEFFRFACAVNSTEALVSKATSIRKQDEVDPSVKTKFELF